VDSAIFYMTEAIMHTLQPAKTVRPLSPHKASFLRYQISAALGRARVKIEEAQERGVDIYGGRGWSERFARAIAVLAEPDSEGAHMTARLDRIALVRDDHLRTMIANLDRAATVLAGTIPAGTDLRKLAGDIATAADYLTDLRERLS
jgi:hypothetical protein